MTSAGTPELALTTPSYRLGLYPHHALSLDGEVVQTDSLLVPSATTLRWHAASWVPSLLAAWDAGGAW